MADLADKASQVQQMFLEKALKAQSEKMVLKTGSEFCSACDCTIPAKRRMVVQGCTTCVSCQNLKEKRR